MTITLNVTATPIQVLTTPATTAYTGAQVRDLGQMLGRDRVAKTAAYTVVAGDRGKSIDCTSGTFTVSLTAAATLANGFHVAIANSGSGTITIDGNAAETIRGPAGSAVTLALAQGQGVVLVCDGTGWLVTAATGLAAASGTALSIADDKLTVTGSVDATKLLTFQVDTQGAGFGLTFDVGAQTASRSLTVPILTANDTIAVLGLAQTFTTLKTFSAGLTVSSGTAAVQALTATTGVFSGAVTAAGYSIISFSNPGTACARLRNTSTTGYSAIDMHDDANNFKAAFGYANASASAEAGNVYLSAGSGVSISLRPNNARTALLSGTSSLFLTSLLSSSVTGGVGYATGAGGTVTQLTSRSTGVTINKICGQITTNNTSLASGAEVSFVVTNSAIAATDVVVLSIASGTTSADTKVSVAAVGAGSFTILIANLSGGAAETGAFIINFAAIKSVSA